MATEQTITTPRKREKRILDRIFPRTLQHVFQSDILIPEIRRELVFPLRVKPKLKMPEEGIHKKRLFTNKNV